METAAPAPAGAVTAPELTRLYEAKGPFLTLYMATEAEIENAAQKNELRWRNLRNELSEQGVPETVLDAIDDLIPDAHHEGQTLAVIANSDGVLHVEHNPNLPKTDIAQWASLPSLVPLLEWRQSSPAHVMVLADRKGADLIAVDRKQREVHREAGGGEDPIAKSAPGGWSQRRYQQRAENVWDQNAQDVAKQVIDLTDKTDARLVVAAGDERALQLLNEHLPDTVKEKLVVVDGGRGVDGSTDEIASDVVRAVDTAVAADTVAFLRKFKEELGQDDRAVDGVNATLAALAAAQVDVLLVHDDFDDDREAWFGELPTQIGPDRATVDSLGANEPQSGRLVDVAVRSAFLTSAGARVVPSSAGGIDGLGAILRWST